MSSKKLILARMLHRIGALRAIRALHRSWAGPHVRAVNYHEVPPSQAPLFEAQLQQFAKEYVGVGAEELIGLQRGEWRASKPGLIITFDDGIRSDADVAAPLLEKYGFTGWFMIPCGFVDTAPADQVDFARNHDILYSGEDYGDDRIAVSWDDLRSMSQRHVIGSHTESHVRLSDELGAEDLEQEIPAAKARMESELAREVDTFCWVGGEEWAYSAAAAEKIAESNYRFSFMTNNELFRPGGDLLQIQRTNLEASWEPELIAFQLSGLMDLLYAPKRGRVNRLTQTRRPPAS